MTMLPNPRPTARSLRLAGATALALIVAGVAGAATPAAADDLNHITITRASGINRTISLGVNKSMILDLPADAHEVIVSQPGIASAIMRSKRRAILQGMGVGDTNIFFLDDRGAQIATLSVSVAHDDSTLTNTLARLLPASAIVVQAFGDRLVLSGNAQSQDDVAKAIAIAGQFAGGPGNVTSVINVSGPQQVALKVTVAEVSRAAVKQLGIDLTADLGGVGGALTTGVLSPSALGGASNVVTGNALTANLSVPGLTLKTTLRALEQRGLSRTLDEPTLTAMSGQAAEFTAGGEFPVPTDATNTNGQTQVSYAFKEFGVKLNFTPTVKSDGVINLSVDTSVSEPTTDGAVTVNGLTIPATKNREAKTVVELPPGSTLSIAGLFEDKVRAQISNMPGLGNIPILGALFRSRDFVHDQTELVILVTPYLVNPGPMPALPTDGVVAAGDAEANFLGHLQKLYGVNAADAPPNQYHGSVGFALE